MTSASNGAGALSEFAKWAITEGAFTGGELSGGEVQDMAVELGLLREVPYDPVEHGESEFGTEPGDSWFEFAGQLKDGLPLPAASGAAPTPIGWMWPEEHELLKSGNMAKWENPFFHQEKTGENDVAVYDADAVASLMQGAASGAASGWMAKVRALEWRPIDDMSSLAHSTVGTYYVSQTDAGWEWEGGRDYVSPNATAAGWNDTEEEAKAAAQADYNARIIAALDIPPSVDGLDAGEDRLPRGVAGAAEDETDSEADGEWRRLALQFDAHRIEALSWLRAMVGNYSEDHWAGAVAFLAAPPLSGEQVLADRIAALTVSPAGDDPKALVAAARHVRHKKAGGTYEVVGIAKMQAAMWVEVDAYDDHLGNVDMREVVVYRSVEHGTMWVRPVAEFEDGRFEDVPAPEGVAAARSSSTEAVEQEVEK